MNYYVFWIGKTGDYPYREAYGPQLSSFSEYKEAIKFAKKLKKSKGVILGAPIKVLTITKEEVIE